MATALVMVAAALPRWVSLIRAAGAPDVTLREDEVTLELGQLAERKEMLMQLIQSTEFDFAAGKITDDARDATLKKLKREAVTVMKRMESIGGSAADVEAASSLLAAGDGGSDA